MLGYQQPSKRIAKVAIAHHLGSILIGAIRREIPAQDRNPAMDILQRFTPGRDDKSYMIDQSICNKTTYFPHLLILRHLNEKLILIMVQKFIFYSQFFNILLKTIMFNNIVQYFFTQYINLSMDVTVKVNFKNNNKMLTTSGNYKEFCEKLMTVFELLPTVYYRLFYISPHGHEISITDSRKFTDFYKCQLIKKPKLMLEKTLSAALNFQAEFQHHRSIYEKNQELQNNKDWLNRQVYAKIEQFKAETLKKINIDLKNLYQSLKKPKKNKSGVIHSGITCQSCKVQEIEGVRYECAICDYNICEDCEERGYDHNPMHPLIKIKDETQMLATKDNRLRHKEEKKQEPIKVEGPHIDMELVKGLMEVTSIDQAHAIAFIKKHNTMDIQQLIDAFFSQQ